MKQRNSNGLIGLAKRYPAASLLVGSLLVGAVPILLMTRPWVRPKLGPELLALRRIEQNLALPEAQNRTENDSGEYVDFKGAHRSTMYIWLQYAESEPVQSAVQRAERDGWEQLDIHETGSTWSVYMVHRSMQACLSARTDGSSVDPLPHSVYILGASDDGCSTMLAKEKR